MTAPLQQDDDVAGRFDRLGRLLIIGCGIMLLALMLVVVAVGLIIVARIVA